MSPLICFDFFFSIMVFSVVFPIGTVWGRAADLIALRRECDLTSA